MRLFARAAALLPRDPASVSVGVIRTGKAVGSLVETEVRDARATDGELPISRDAIENVGKYAREFNSATPYKHICIDRFLDEDFATALIAEFPVFKAEETRTETGTQGRKLTKPNLSNHGPNFRKLAAMFSSPQFLRWLSELTAIEDLSWGGENMWGGGTHDNQNHADLDFHVDFNFDESTGLHRRLNALIFLNREWEPEWGGQSEMAEDPWDSENRNIKRYEPVWNRLILFETNERSWHGFPRIKIPADKSHLSRRSVAAYFYTKTRPQNEIVGSHSTFYVQRHIPETV
ncbi:MAG TPA: 2OG-Fe(II) oxygenase, partial [Rhizomicrobium sp.]